MSPLSLAFSSLSLSFLSYLLFRPGINTWMDGWIGRSSGWVLFSFFSYLFLSFAGPGRTVFLMYIPILLHTYHTLESGFLGCRILTYFHIYLLSANDTYHTSWPFLLTNAQRILLVDKRRAGTYYSTNFLGIGRKYNRLSINSRHKAFVFN